MSIFTPDQTEAGYNRKNFIAYLKLPFSFEFINVLALFSYQYKNALQDFIAFDVTVFLNLLLIPWAIILYFRERNQSSLFFSEEVLIFLAMTGWFLVSTLWSTSALYKTQKALCFSFYTVPSFLMGYFVISKNPERVQRLLGSFLIFSLLVLAETFRIFYLKGMGSIQDILGTNYLVTGQTLGAGLIILLTCSLYRFHHKQNRISKGEGYKTFGLEILLSSLLVYGLINIGGRGPVISCFIVTIVLYALFNQKPYSLKINLTHLSLFLLASSIVFIGLNYFFNHQGSHFQNRMVPLLNSIQTDGPTMERLEFYGSALKAFWESPLIGVGFGGWPMYHGLGDVSYHPHNIFLEIMAETGTVGLLFFLTFLYVSLKGLKLNTIKSNLSLRMFYFIALFSFINACKTGDLHDNILLFFSLSLVAGLKKTSLIPPKRRDKQDNNC